MEDPGIGVYRLRTSNRHAPRAHDDTALGDEGRFLQSGRIDSDIVRSLYSGGAIQCRAAYLLSTCSSLERGWPKASRVALNYLFVLSAGGFRLPWRAAAGRSPAWPSAREQRTVLDSRSVSRRWSVARRLGPGAARRIVDSAPLPTASASVRGRRRSGVAQGEPQHVVYRRRRVCREAGPVAAFSYPARRGRRSQTAAAVAASEESLG